MKSKLWCNLLFEHFLHTFKFGEEPAYLSLMKQTNVILFAFVKYRFSCRDRQQSVLHVTITNLIYILCENNSVFPLLPGYRSETYSDKRKLSQNYFLSCGWGSWNTKFKRQEWEKEEPEKSMYSRGESRNYMFKPRSFFWFCLWCQFEANIYNSIFRITL